MDKKVVSNSRQKLVIIGLLITLVNPIFAGLIFGIYLYTEREFKKDGRLIIFLSLIWGSIAFLLASRFGLF